MHLYSHFELSIFEKQNNLYIKSMREIQNLLLLFDIISVYTIMKKRKKKQKCIINEDNGCKNLLRKNVRSMM